MKEEKMLEEFFNEISLALHYEGGNAENFLINLDNGWANRMTKFLEKVRFEKSQKTEIGDIIKIGENVFVVLGIDCKNIPYTIMNVQSGEVVCKLHMSVNQYVKTNVNKKDILEEMLKKMRA